METLEVIDQMGRKVTVPKHPRSIISLVPSQTELLINLGVGERLKGITKFCIHPKEEVKNYTIVGGTKKFRFDTIEALKPDLIIGNKEENYQEGIEQLASQYPVWMSDINSFDDALEMIASAAQLVNSEKAGNRLIREISAAFSTIKQQNGQKTLYLIWRNPYMAAGKNTFIHQMIEKIGLKNAVTADRYPELSESAIKALNPDLILLSSEPYPFKKKHKQELQAICPNATICLVDGEMFSWYGSRLKKAADYFNSFTV